MKYIRTKEKIIDFSQWQRVDGGFATINDSLYDCEIIKQADTIEELCDRCLVITRYHKEPIYGTFYELEDYIDEWKRKLPSNDPIVDIYGAIWADKGLIYVAKMNEKGELELL